jgi:hypothetical protein
MMNQGIDQGVAQRVDAYRGNPQALQQKYAVSQELVDLLALQKIKSEKEAAARQMQLQMSQQQAANGEPPTVAEQREKEVMDMTKQEMVQQQAGLMQQKQQQEQQGMQRLAQGIASAPGAQMAAQPQMMAAGGIVAFAGPDGSQVKGEGAGKKEPDAAARAAMAEAQRTGDRNAMLDTLKKLAAAGYDVVTLIPRGLIGAVEDLANTRVGRALGLDFDASEITGSMTPMMDKIRQQEAAAAQPEASAEAEAPRQNPLRAQEAEANIAYGPEAAPEAAPVVPAPVAPVAAAAPAKAAIRSSSLPAQQAGPSVNLSGMPQEGQFGKDMQEGVRGLMNRDPNAMARAGRKEGLAFLTTPGRKEAVDAQQQGLADLDAQQLDPEQIREQKLQNFLLGAGGQGSIGRALGAGGRSAVNFERNRADEQRRRLLERNKMLRDEFDIDARDRKGAFEAGEKRFGEGAADMRQGIASGVSMRNTDQTTAASVRNTNVNAQVSLRNADQQMQTAGLDRDSRERISEMQAQVQQETSAALRANATQAERNRAYGNAETRLLRAEKQASASFDRQINQITDLQGLGQKLDPAQQTRLDQLIEDKERAVRAAVAPIEAEMNRLAGADGGSKLPPDITDLVKQYPNQRQ